MDLLSNKNDYQHDASYTDQEPSPQNQNHDDSHESHNTLLHWQGPEFEHYPKEKKWYLIASFILSAIIIYALINNSPIMAITFILIGIVSYIQLERTPEIMDFKVTHDGIMAGKELYHFDNIQSFWIFYEPPHTKILSLHVDAFLTPYIHIPVHQIDPVELREVLMDFISEKKQLPTLIDTVERVLHI